MSQECLGWQLDESMRARYLESCKARCPRLGACSLDAVLLEMDLSKVLPIP